MLTSFSRDHRASTVRTGCGRTAFTLVELLVTMVVSAIMLVFLFQVFDASTRAWRQGENQAETYREARAAMQLMVRDLSQTISPMTGSVYTSSTSTASPTPTPAALPKIIAPVLVIDRYPSPVPPPQAGDEINEEVYCLTNISNNGASNLCAVGYFCEWKPEFDPNGDRAPHAYSLMRQYLGSGAPANPATGAAAIPGLYDRFKAYSSTLPLTFPNVYERATSSQPTNPPQATVTELASYIWDLQIRTPTGLQDATAAPTYPAQPGTYSTNYPNALPAYLEIRFKALSASAARELAANAGVSRTTWNDASSANNSLYQHIILPGTRQFSVRVPIYSGTATATPSP